MSSAPSSSIPFLLNGAALSLPVRQHRIPKANVAPYGAIPLLVLSTRFSKSLRCFSSSPSHDEALWLREEQRWLREEQRWLREEQRWSRERHALIEEIESLKLRVQSLERGEDDNSGPTLLKLPKKKGLISASSESTVGSATVENEGKRMLRVGCEGEDVREMQEALQQLGFYSGEEDIEYSNFSRGTERAVKSWKASLGLHEDATMTPELLERLFELQEAKSTKPNDTKNQEEVVSTVMKKEHDNGYTFTSTTDTSDVEETATQEDGESESVSYPRVFLLGENRWEQPGRIGNAVNGRKTKSNSPKCISCRGEGRLLCTECDGTGEPNIEPQFMEWMEEGAPCPYCDGVGYTTCDMCDGKAL